MDPRPATNASPRVKLSTPLAIIGLFVEVLRIRFSKDSQMDPDLPWRWEEWQDGTSREDVIFIESGWNTNIEMRNVRPGIWVDRIQSIWTKASIGNQDQMPVDLRIPLEQFHAFGETDLRLDCTSPNRGESMLIGGIVQDFVQMSRNLIAAWFGLRDISNVMLNQTVPFDKDDKLWNSPVSFRVFYETRWASAPVSNLLRAVSLKISDITDPETYFRKIAIREEINPVL